MSHSPLMIFSRDINFLPKSVLNFFNTYIFKTVHHYAIVEIGEMIDYIK